MAATLTAQAITTTGVEPTLSAATQAGDSFVNSGREFIQVKNSNATTARVIAIPATHKCDYNFTHSLSVSVPASTTLMIGPFDTHWFSDINNLVNITYQTGQATDLTIGVFRL